MIQTPVTQVPQYQPIATQPSYNAVKIDINNPQVNAPGYMQNPIQTPPPAPITAPMYSYPQSQIYEVPQQSVYTTQQAPAVSQPKAVQELPSVPPPVIVQPTVNVTPAEAPVPVAAPIPTVTTTPIEATSPVAAAAVTPQPVEATPQPVEVKAPDVNTQPAEATAPAVEPQSVEVKAPDVTAPKLDLNEFLSKLSNNDYEVQASTMEAIADLAQNSPEKATELLDVKVFDALLNIMNVDSSKLEGPSAQQFEIREKIMSGKPVTEAEAIEANKVTPMGQAERNKQYSIYTVAILQKLYGSEVEKMNNTVVPLTELPGAAGIVEQVKNNPNPMVRASALDALSYIQRPEYKQDLTTLFTVAQKDKDVNVQQAAKKALEKLAQIADIPQTTEAPAPVVEAPTPQPSEVKAA